MFKNPDRYARISVHPEGKDEELKKEPSLKMLFSYLEKTCLHPTDTGTLRWKEESTRPIRRLGRKR